MPKKPIVCFVPLAALGCYFQSTAWQLSLSRSLYLLSVLFILLAVVLTKPHIRIAVIIALCLTVGVVYQAIYQKALTEPVFRLVNQEITVSAEIADTPTLYEKDQRATLYISHEDNPFLPKSIRTLAYLPLTDVPLQVGDQVEVTLSFYRFSKSDGFDRGEFYAAKGIYIASSYVKSEAGAAQHFTAVHPQTPRLRYWPSLLATQIKARLAQLLPHTDAGFMTALLLGDRSALAEQDYAAMRIAGLGHVVAVSGMHIGFLASFCMLLFGKRKGTMISLFFILIYAPLAGLTPSVVRAAIMYLIAAGAFCLKKESDSLNSLCIALNLLILQNPFSIASISLQLSFGSALGIIMFSEKINAAWYRPFQSLPAFPRKLLFGLTSSVSCTTSALICTIPILLSSFGYVSVLALFSNLLVLWAISLLFILGVLTCFLLFLSPVAAAWLVKALHLLIGYVLLIAHHIADIPFGIICWDNLFGVTAIGVFLVMLLLLISGQNFIRKQILLSTSTIILCLLTFGGWVYQQNTIQMTVLPCGSGQMILFSRGQQSLYVVDCGASGYRDSSSLLQDWMQQHNFDRVDALILTAINLTQARDLPTLLADNTVSSLYLPKDIRKTKYNTELCQCLEQTEIPKQYIDDSKKTVIDSMPLVLYPVTASKLIVSLSNHVSVLSSPTLKQLSAAEIDGIKCDVAVVSQSDLENPELLRPILESQQAKQLIVQSSVDTISYFDHLQIENTYRSGQIVKHFYERK